ncbi:Aste57867_2377 [Aphanomyces stellatus]|uniref:Aste57867_2377 protein n=1 Tax=Aphanomyces stellatus TaxID=120398 RepID=A0A485KB62_9STRA|nr:hypothetical protein As57867_002371 [Aphanomyces stellatus]VFT79578.1 Aste57867_2377 [Aphanomyces stellatus]
MRLPLDLIRQIGLWVQEPTTFFSFLEALGTPAARGPLDPLWQLLLLHPHKSLWPSLHLTFSMKDHLRLVEDAMPCFTCVRVYWFPDLDWLLHYLRRPIDVEWSADFTLTDTQGLAEWFAQWVQLPLTQLRVFFPRDEPMLIDYFCAAYPQCQNLTCLSIWTTGGPIALPLPTSWSKLVELSLNRVLMTSTRVYQLIHWLASVPVRSIRLDNWSFEANVDNTLQGTFFSALFLHSTLQALTLEECSLTALDHFASTDTLTRTLHTLTLTNCNLNPSSLVGLANSLSDSCLQSFILRRPGYEEGEDDEYMAAFERLFQGVALSSTTHLTLSLCGLDDACWARLAPLIPTTKVERLSLHYNGITDVSMPWLGCAVQGTHTLRTLTLSQNKITTSGFQSFLGHVQTSSLKTLCMMDYDMHQDDQAIQDLVQQAQTVGIRWEFS